MTDLATFQKQVEDFLAAHEMSPTQFGRRFAGDPLFVFQLRDGREPREATRERVLNAMAEYVVEITPPSPQRSGARTPSRVPANNGVA
jgi:homoserine dehydrogenase